jgi:predicted RNA-binding protein with PIN domain
LSKESRKKQRRALVDGYNLIKCVPVFSEVQNRSLEAARKNLETALAAYARCTNEQIAIYYDGDPQVEHPDHQRRGDMDIFFSRRPQQADDLIKRVLEQRHGTRDLRVISSDREIQRFAKRHKIAFTNSQAFADEVENPVDIAQYNENIEAEIAPNWAPASGEIDEWERAFAQTQNEEPVALDPTRALDPNLALKKREVDEWEKLFANKQNRLAD